MIKQRNDHVGPLLVIPGWSGVSFPVEDGLGAARKLLRHKSKLKVRTYPKLKEAVDDPVYVGVIILCLSLAVFLVLMVYCHIIGKKPVTSDI